MCAGLEGPQTLGRGRAFWIAAAVVVVLAAAYPLVTDRYTVGNTVYFFNWVFMALGLCLIWGYGGALSFGQTAFFGLAGYAYGIVTLNFGAAYGLTLAATVLAVAAAALLRRRAGLFPVLRPHQRRFPRHRHAGRDAGVRALHGADRRTRMARRLSAAQRLQRHERHAAADDSLARRRHCAGARHPALLCHSGAVARDLSGASHLGEFVIRQRAWSRSAKTRYRATMLGYDVRKYQLATFVIGSALAGLSGVLYTTWGQYITPSSMGLTAAALPVIWVAVGGRGDLTTTLLGTLLLLGTFQALTIYGSQYALVVMGLLLVLTVLLAPERTRDGVRPAAAMARALA